MADLGEWASLVSGGVEWVGELVKWRSWVSGGVGCVAELQE